MAKRLDGAALRQLGTLFNLGAVREATDGQLLERFSAGHGEAAELAFAALVERHGPMVLRVCRSILRDEHDAQDAFQATFLVLVRKARGLWVRDSLGPWLHQVAYRAAGGARSARCRRAAHERRATGRAPDRIAAEEDGEDLGGMLHEEIDRLPGRYRAVVVLCDLEGRTHEQAARHLGCPTGTVKSRLSRGRQRLRLRLVRRGLMPSVGLGAGLWAETAWAAVPRPLATATAGAAARIAAGGAAMEATSVVVDGLVRATSRGMPMSSFRMFAGVVALVLATTAGAAGLVRRGADRPAPVPAPADAEPAARDDAVDEAGGAGEPISPDRLERMRRSLESYYSRIETLRIRYEQAREGRLVDAQARDIRQSLDRDLRRRIDEAGADERAALERIAERQEADQVDEGYVLDAFPSLRWVNRTTRTFPDGAKETLTLEKIAYDGRYTQIRHEQDNVIVQEAIDYDMFLQLPSSLLGLRMHQHPTGPPLSDLLKFPEVTTIEGEEAIAGLQTIVVQVGPDLPTDRLPVRLKQAERVVLWLAPALSYLPVRSDFHFLGRFGGPPHRYVHRIELSEFEPARDQAADEDIPFPRRMNYTGPMGVTRWRITEVIINSPVGPQDFQADLGE